MVAIAASTLILLVAALHVYILVLEMFLWRKPAGRRAFGTSAEFAEASAALAANQGLYNGFLAAGLFWAFAVYGLTAGRPLLTFFLGCVMVAGVYGGLSVNRRIIFVQAAPALIALVLLWLV